MNREIAAVIQCRFCHQRLSGPTIILGPTVPKNGSNRIAHFLESISTHIAKCHPQEFEYLQQKSLEFMGLQMLMQYTTTDEGVRYSREWLRWQIHQATLSATIPNEKIADQSNVFAKELVSYFYESMATQVETGTPGRAEIEQKTTERVRELATGIRDVLQEPYEPPVPPSVKVLQAN